MLQKEDGIWIRPIGTRWHTLVGTMITASITGMVYVFSVTSSALKKQFNFTQPQLETISIVSFCAGILSWVPGLLTDKIGPRLTVMLCGSFGATMALLQYLFSSKKITMEGNETPIIVFSVLAALRFLCSAGVTGATFSTIVRNFPEERGIFIGLAKGWVGLCGGMMAQMFVAFYMIPDDTPATLNFLLLASIVFASGTVFPALLLAVHPPQSEASHLMTINKVTKKYRLIFLYALLFVTGVVVTMSAFLIKHIPSKQRIGFGIAILFLWASPPFLLCSCFGKMDEETHKSKTYPSAHTPSGNSPTDSGDDLPNPLLSPNVIQTRHISALPDMPLSQVVQTIDCWTLFYITTVVVGGGIMVTTNSGQMCEALGHKDKVATVVALFSVSQAASRVIVGGLSDAGMKQKVPRVWWLLLSTASITLGHAILLISGLVPLYIGMVFTGIGFGSIWPLMVILVSEIFGLTYHSGNYMLYDGGSSAFGSLIFGKYLTEYFYDKHQVDNKCIGSDCFFMTHLITAAAAATAFLLAVFLSFRLKKLYRQIFTERELC